MFTVIGNERGLPHTISNLCIVHIGWLYSRSLVQIIFQKKCKCMEYISNQLLQLILIKVYALNW